MKKYIFLTFSIIIAECTNSQNQSNNWFFGDSVIVRFNDATIDALVASGEAMESSASISNSAGDLLFYTNGNNVWNNSNYIMPNGSNLDIDQLFTFGSSVTQGVIIIPKPYDDNMYYIFTISNTGFNNSKPGLSYHLIDLTQDFGNGDIVSKNNIAITDTISEQMCAIKHGNGNDWWLLVHKSYPDPENSNEFIKLLITPDGIEGPFPQIIGNSKSTVMGQLAVSLQGDKIAYADRYGLEIFDFDRCTGNLIEAHFINSEIIDQDSIYGCAFSPDGSKVYISTLPWFNNSRLYQYCFNCQDSFEDSKKLLLELNEDDFFIGQFQNAPNEKIYFTTVYNSFPSLIFNDYNMNLNEIAFPNEEDSACSIILESIWLSGKRSLAGLPNFPNYSLGPLYGSDCDTIFTGVNDPINSETSVNFYPNPVNNLLNITYENVETLSISLYDIYGVEYFQSFYSAVNNNEMQINVEQIPIGFYLLQVIINNNEKVIHKIVKK